LPWVTCPLFAGVATQAVVEQTAVLLCEQGRAQEEILGHPAISRLDRANRAYRTYLAYKYCLEVVDAIPQALVAAPSSLYNTRTGARAGVLVGNDAGGLCRTLRTVLWRATRA
jgi:hypothetical protein